MNLLIFNALSWEQRKLFEMATFSKGSGYSKADLAPSGTPIILYGRMYTKYETIIKEVDTFAEEKAGSVYSKGGEVIVPASGETAEDISRASVVENTGVLLGGDINIIHPNDNLIPGFLALTISNGNQQKKLSAKAQGASIVHLHNEDLKDVDILYPTIAEQRKISEFFQGLDDTITLHQSKAESWKNKKNQLSTISWEQRKLSEVVTEIKRTDEKSDAPVMMITAENGFINQSERYSTNNAGQSLKKYILLEKGELAYNHGASKLRPYGSCFALTTEEKARIPFVYHCFSTETENSEFLSIVLNGKAVEKQLRRIVSSGARMDGLLNISFDEYTSIPVMLPRKDEQDRIAEYFKNLDHLITLHHRKLNRTQICINRSFLYGSF